ncbi:winged helix-turn-helix transcriptional regulator [Robertkochia solimangrovi]|uniref:winged helix-turn-helix transcriptional regulator n=1 Tax=Robertkochia solimangrovi TaxID=2213046 RepID=UPI00117E69EF|nr:helix-turn-helix domain-containing protein [Robertkochia solimangrovi]TRZ41955.1 transcriptional regulator [Robertkochia solimangrovi]
MYKVKGKKYPCCTSVAMGIIGGKWKAAILYYLSEQPLRYSEIRRQMPTVTERTLSLQLKSLVEDGVLSRRAYTSKPPLTVEYSLTDFGKTLIPIISGISDWGAYVVKNHSDAK